MTAILVTPPAAEPLTIADLRHWLRIDGTEEDALIASLLATARATIERETRRCLMPQTWRLSLDAWPSDGLINLPVAPVQSIVAFQVLTAEGHISVPATAYRTDFARERPRLWITHSMPQPGVGGAGIEIDLLCGYATAAAVPEELRHAIRLMVARLYEHRGDGPAEIPALPPAIGALLAGFRAPRLA